MRWALVLCLSIFCCSLFLPDGVSAQIVEVTGQRVNIRTGPGTTYGVIGSVTQGEHYPVVERVSGWYKIRLDDGREGWIAGDLVRKQEHAQSIAVKSTSPTLVGKDGAEMVLVPAGEFVMGSAAEEIDQLLRNFPDLKREWFEREIPKHRVYLDAFYLDKYEVTNARFQQFVQATGYRTTAEQAGWGLVWNESKKQGEKINGASWKAPHGSGSTIQDLEMHPVVQVNWDDAQAYCEWAGKRLPTEAEWEKAARGTEGWTYPWGHQFDGRKLNFCDRNCETDWKDRGVNDGYRYTAPVGRFEGGKSPYGAYDMAGNVWEWVADWYDEDYYRNSPARNPQGPESGQYRVLRGGAWIGGQYDVRVSFRLRLIPETRFAYLGVRCAKTP